jgi:hypothetical protein
VRWQVSVDGGTTFHNIRAATEPTLTVKVQARDNRFEYRAAFANRYGVGYTGAATLRVSAKAHALFLARLAGFAFQSRTV